MKVFKGGSSLAPPQNYLLGIKDKTFLITYTPKGIPTAIKSKGETSLKTVEMFAVKSVAKSTGNVII